MQIYLVFLRRVSRNLRTLLAFTMLVATTIPSTPMRAQTLRDYEFSTGVDASKWKTATNWTTIFTSSDNGNLASGVLNIGFPFPFGSGTYTQFSVNTKGNFRLGPEATANWKQAGLFTSAYYTRNYPKISGVVSNDGFNLGSNGYIRYALTGTAPTRVFVCEYRVNNNNVVGSEANMMWQVQLYEATGEVAIVYGSTDLSAPANCPHNYQTGLATSPTDIVVLPPNTHMPVYSTTYNETLYYTWHGTNRYYSFMLPSSTCPRPESIAISDIGPTWFTATWVDNSGSTQWEVRLDRRNVQGTPVVVNTPTYTFTNLTNGTDYTVRVRGICGPGDTTAVRSLPVQTLCGYLPLPYSEGFEDALATSSNESGNGLQNNLPNCWDYHNEGSDYSFYPCVKVGSGLNFAHSGTNYMRSYVNTSSSYKPQYAFLPLTDPIQHPVNSLELRYWIRCQNSSPYHPGTCIVGITPDPTDISTFIPVNTVTYNSITWSERTVQFNNYTGPHGRVTILFPKQTGHPNWTFIDDIYLFFHNSFDTVTHTACNSYTWPENGTTYTNSGTYNTTLPNAAGYDSIITLHLTIKNSTTGDTTVTTCNSFTWWNTNYTNSTNSATHTFTNAAGCDSVVTLHLTINHSNTGDTTATACDSFSWWNTNYTNSTNTPTHLYSTTAGCDSLVTLHLTINHSTTGDTTATACDSFTWWGNSYTNSTNTATHTFTNAAGCDSVVTLHLTINHSNTGDTIATACDSFTWWNTNYTNSTNTATHTFTNAAGCDSVVTLHLTINHSNTGDTTVTTCNSFTWWNTNYSNSTNTATHTFTNAAGCDSVVTLHLTINHSNTGDTTATACDSFSWWNTNYTNSTNSATHTFTNAAGCDSVVTLHLTINHSTIGDTTATACDSFSWWNTNYTNSTNSATHTFTNAAGCDSVVTLHLTINHSNTGDTSVTACDSFIWWGTTYTSSTNTATHTFTNAAGCDSVVTLHLTIKNSTTGDTTVTTCNSFTWWNTNYTNSTNSATHTFTNAADCDSVVTLHLTINHSTIGDTTATACDSFSWWNTNYTNSTNSATHTFTNAAGCDSVVTLHLTINHSNTGDTTATACDSFTWWGTPYSTTGDYVRTWPSALPGGCDSVVTLHLTVNYSSTGIEDTTVCNSIVWHGTEYTASTNTPTFTCLNTAGCDSVTTLHLTVNHCSTTPITVCDSYTWRGHTYTTSGIYVDGTDTLNLTVNHSNTGDTTATACDSFTWHGTNYTNSTQNSTFTIQNSVGCDSVLTLHLTINHTTTGDTTATACDSFTWWNTNYTNSTNSASHTFTNAAGCDSVVTLHLTINHSNTGDTSVTACDSFTWWNTNYTNSTNSATHTFTNVVGCDSVVTLHLTINHSNTGDTNATACNSFAWWGNNYTSSTNTATHTLTNAVGCDSVVTLHLTINHSNTGDTTATACNSFTWWGTPYSTTGDYVRTWPSALPGGCDSVVTLHLTVNYSSTGIEDTTVCNSIVWHGTEYTTSTNTPTFTCLNAAGCDSVTTLHLTVNHCSTTPITICDSYTWHGNTYTATGIYIDGTDTLNLTVNHSNTGDTTVTACDSFTWHGTNYTNSTQNSTFTIQNSVGCDSVVTLHLTINHTTTGDTTATACDSFIWWGTNYTTTGDFMRTWPSAFPGGCDSVVTLHLTVNYSSTGDTMVMACDSFTWWGTNYTTTGDFMRTWPSAFPGGCDSVVTLHLTVNYSSTGDTMVMACDSFTWWGTNYTSSTNTATQTFTNLAGCDFVVTLHLTINHSNTGIEDTTVCNSFIWHGTEYTSSTSTPTFTCLNAAGCDSVTTLHLTVNQCSSTTVTACDSYTWRGNTYTATGIYTDGTDTLNLIVNHSNTGDTTVTACDSFTWWGTNYTSTGDFMRTWPSALPGGCDSVVTLHLTINHTTTGDTTATACDSFIWWGTNYTSTGDFMRTWPSAFPGGCDSVVTLHLTINHTTTGDTTATACDSFIWWGTNYTTTGDFMRTWPSAFPGGCDSTVTLHLTVNPMTVLTHTPDTVIMAGDTITLRATGATWLTWTDSNGAQLSNTGYLSVHPTVTTSYYVSSFSEGPNLVYNGDFELGNTGFINDYIYGNTGSYGHYHVGYDIAEMWPWDSPGFAVHDHTSNSGLFLMIDGAIQPMTRVWSQTVEVTPHTEYLFSSWILTDNAGYFKYEINGVQTGFDYVTPDTQWEWKRYSQVWNSDTCTHATLSIVNRFSQSAGYDYCIDDITFSPLTSCSVTDTVTVNIYTYTYYDSSICADMLPFVWHNNNLYSSGIYTDTINAGGNDIIVTLTLSVNPVYNDTINDTICSNGSSLFEGVSYTTAGLHTVPLHTTAGCDSIRSLNLTVNAAHSADTTAMVCDSIIWNGVWRTANGDYSYTTTTATGCDSTATLHLTVNHSTIGDTTASACDSFTWHGTNYTNSTQNATFTIQNSVGCDSVVTLHLTINHATTGDTTVTACDSFTWHGTNYTNSTQNATFTIQNSVGCDSVVTLHLTVNYSNTGIEDTTVCNSFVWHGTTYTESTQNSTFTIQNSVGCDSTITLHLTVNQCSSTSVTACDSYTWHGSTYTETGIYTDGADTLHLTINLSTTGDTTATACGSFTWHGTTYTESTQNPTFTSQNSNGCDSTVTLRLTIYNSTSATDSVTSCHPLQWVDGNTYTASTDSPVFTLQSVHGCDSVVTLHFELLPTSYTDIADSFCTGTPYLFGTLILTEGGLYTDTLTAANSCDSIVSLNLTKLLLPHINIVQTDDCLTQSHYIHVETDVDYLYWTCDASSWNNSWGSVHSRNLTVNNHYPVTLTLMADYYEYPTCPNTAIVTLQPLVQPHALMTVSPEFITYETPTLVALSQSTGAQRLQWYIDGDDAGNSQSITYTPPSGYDSVVVTLIAFSDFCSDTTERTIPIKQQALYLPNAFTPNESTNNTFSVFYDGIVEYELYIYNRQGTLLFHSNTNGEAWDGRYNGIPCPEGSYVWLVKYRSEVDPQNWHYAKGTVTLIY